MCGLGELEVAGGMGVDFGEIWDKAYAWLVGDFYCAGRGDGYLGVDYVAVPVAGAGGDVAWEGEVGEGGKVNVVGAAYAGFEHAAAPDGDVVLLAEIVD